MPQPRIWHPAFILAMSCLAVAGCKKAVEEPRNVGVAEQKRDASGNPPAQETLPNTAPPNSASDAQSGQQLRWGNLVGSYKGPEGMTLDITLDGKGGFMIKNRWGLDADMGASFPGQSAEHGIAATRAGKPVIFRPTDGDGTGMKWLAGKKDCVMVEVGEGYCRD